MDIKAILAAYTEEPAYTIEGQIRWLQKQGFSQDQIDQAVLTVYFDLERGVIPNKFTRKSEGKPEPPIFLAGNMPPPNADWAGVPISGGHELDQCLLSVAKSIRTRELNDKAAQLGELVAKMKSQWEADAAKANAKPGFFKRLFAKSES